MSFDAIFSGSPANSPFPSAANTVTSGIDTNAGAEWVNVGKGWQPLSDAFARTVQLGISAEPANFVVAIPVTGLYRVSVYEISTVATSGTLPAINAAYTEGDIGTTTAATAVVADAATSAAKTINQGSTILNILGGTNLTLSGASYATTTYNIKIRVEFLG